MGLAALVLQLAPACCLVRPTDAKTLVEAGNSGLRTPEAAFETFRAAFGADLPELEFRCLSSNFKRENQVSYATYRIARQKLIDAKPYLALLAQAKVQSGSVISARKHRLIVQTAGQRFEIELVREDEFQIYSGAVFLADGTVDFDRRVKVSDSGTGQTVNVELSIPSEDLGGADLRTLTSLRVERVWKIERFGDTAAP